MPKAKPGTVKKQTGIEIPHRYPSGDGKPDNQRKNAPALIKRIFDHAVKLGGDRRVATVLGRLHLEEIITETEFTAGMLYAEDVGAWERIKGHPRRETRSPSFDSGSGKADVDLEALERMDPEAAANVKAKITRSVRRIEKRYHKAQDCIPLQPILLSALLEEVCCNDRPIHSLHHPALKAMLGNLARQCYRLHDTTASTSRSKPNRDKKADVTALAEAAADALDRQFEKVGGKVAFFRVQSRHEMQARIIVAYGTDRDSKSIEHSIKLKRPAGIKGAEIDMALEKAALAKDWKQFERKDVA